MKNFLFLTYQGKSLTNRETWWDKFNRAYEDFIEENPWYEEQDEWSKITPHLFRHTFCTELAKRKIPEKAIIALAGHHDYDFTLRNYTHFDYETIKSNFLEGYESDTSDDSENTDSSDD